jgi:hypothetical protein
VLTLGAVVLRLAWRTRSCLPPLAVVSTAGITAETALRPGAAIASRVAAIFGLVVVLTWAELMADRAPRSYRVATGT